MAQRIFNILNRLELKIARAQGKGYGTNTVVREVGCVFEHLPETPKLAIDVGGNIGDYAAELCSRVPTMKIHVFEPAAVNVARLQARFKENQHIFVVPLALSDVGAETTLFSNGAGSPLASLTKRKLDHFQIDFDHQETVRSVRFEDYWVAELGSAPIDVAKIDVEGHELATLRGFGRALEKTRVVQFEFGGTNIDTRTFFRDFWYFFAERGFVLHRITPFGLQHISRYQESDENFSATNFIAVNSSPIYSGLA